MFNMEKMAEKFVKSIGIRRIVTLVKDELRKAGLFAIHEDELRHFVELELLANAATKESDGGVDYLARLRQHIQNFERQPRLYASREDLENVWEGLEDHFEQHFEKKG